MARRTKQRSMIDRRKRSANLKRISASVFMLLSVGALYLLVSMYMNKMPLQTEPEISNTAEPTVGTVILLTTPKTQTTPTLEPLNTVEPTTEATVEPTME